jgi:hypothetical protein
MPQTPNRDQPSTDKEPEQVYCLIITRGSQVQLRICLQAAAHESMAACTYPYMWYHHVLYLWYGLPNLGLVFLAIGIALLIIAGQIMEKSGRYDDSANCQSIPPLNTTKICTFNFTLDKTMESPVFVYYEIK